jgi:hypothetical protein
MPGGGKPFRRRPGGDPAREYATVAHFRLTPAGVEANQWASVCPFCTEGRLLCVRNPVTFVLEHQDVCTLCGQRVEYEDIDDMRDRDWAGRGE